MTENTVAGEPIELLVEAELMLKDADALAPPSAGERSYRERAADALLALALRVGDAVADSSGPG